MIQNLRGRNRLLGLAVGLTLMGTFSAAMSLAVFTDQETVDGSFTSGSIVLDDVKVDGLTLSISPLMPGDTITDDVVVENDGTAQLRYSIGTSTTDPDTRALRNALNLTVKTVDVTTPGTPCDNFDGTQLYSGDLDSTDGKIVGDATQGTHTGDRVLNGATSETLCFQVSLASTATGPTNASTTAVFSFSAEQTANNA